MIFLVITTLVWAFSFSFIGVYLSQSVDVWLIAVIRFAMALIVFLPFLRIKGLSAKTILLFIVIGALQIGLMSLFYYHAFFYLKVAEILLFTITTPFYVTVFYDLLSGKRIRISYIVTAVIAIIGAAIIRYQQPSTQFWFGFFLLQGANICFALGQVCYKHLLNRQPTISQTQACAWFYVGAFLLAAILWGCFADYHVWPTTLSQWLVLIWLGIVASGAGYFLWNYGATKVDAGVLAIMNNALIPVGIIVNVVIWKQSIAWGQFMAGCVVMAFSLALHYWLVKRQ